jgi:hypothetical protein
MIDLRWAGRVASVALVRETLAAGPGGAGAVDRRASYGADLGFVRAISALRKGGFKSFVPHCSLRKRDHL